MSPPKTLVIGCRGFLGSAFLDAYRKIYNDSIGQDIDPPHLNDCYFIDLASPSIRPLKLKEKGYEDALILAGITKVALCEKEKERTRQINVYGTTRLIEELIEEGIKPIFFSSDYVFDGEKGGYRDYDPVSPINEYGRQKAEIERTMGEIGTGNYLIIRLSKVFSLQKGDNSLFDEMARVIYNGGKIKAATDQIFSPVLINDVIKAVLELQSKRATGIFNVCSKKAYSRYELALMLTRKMKKKEKQIEPIYINDLDPEIKRPKNTSMVPKRLFEETGLEFDNVPECIAYIAKSWE